MINELRLWTAAEAVQASMHKTCIHETATLILSPS